LGGGLGMKGGLGGGLGRLAGFDWLDRLARLGEASRRLVLGLGRHGGRQGRPERRPE
jgi:hypothetical protein